MKFVFLIAAIANGQQSESGWMVLFKAGWGLLADGLKFLVDRDAFDLLAASIAARGNEIHFDYEHASLEKQAAPAAGWIKELAWEEGVGIKAKVQWTQKAKEFIQNLEYRYFSPVFAIRKKDLRVCYLDSVALTNRPKTTNLQPILARLDAVAETPKGGPSMDRKQLCAALGLPETAADAEILAAVAKLGVTMPETKTETKEVIPRTVTAALGLAETDTETVVVASIHALKQASANGVTAEAFAELQAKIADREASDAVAAAMAAGKVAPAQKDWAMTYAKADLKGFGLFVGKAPVVVPLADLKKPPKEESARMDDATLAVARDLGVTEEDLKKYGGIAAQG